MPQRRAIISIRQFLWVGDQYPEFSRGDARRLFMLLLARARIKPQGANGEIGKEQKENCRDRIIKRKLNIANINDRVQRGLCERVEYCSVLLVCAVYKSPAQELHLIQLLTFNVRDSIP